MEPRITQDLPVSLEEALVQLAEAQETIEQLQQIRKLANWFFHVVLNYDIRTPLNLLTGFVEVILQEIDGSIPNQIRDDLIIVRRQAGTINDVINTVLGILQAERIKMGEETERPSEEVNLKEIIQNIKLPEETKVQINTDMDSLPNLYITPNRLERIITDIVFALEFSEGRAIIDVENDDKWSIIRISNQKMTLFDEPQVKLQQAVTGPSFFFAELIPYIVLAIACYFIELHGGKLDLKSEYENGTVVTIALPIYGS